MTQLVLSPSGSILNWFFPSLVSLHGLVLCITCFFALIGSFHVWLHSTSGSARGLVPSTAGSFHSGSFRSWSCLQPVFLQRDLVAAGMFLVKIGI